MLPLSVPGAPCPLNVGSPSDPLSIFRLPSRTGLSNLCKLIGHSSDTDPPGGTSWLFRKLKHTPFCWSDQNPVPVG